MTTVWPANSPTGVFRLVDRHEVSTIVAAASAASIWIATVDLHTARTKADAMVALRAGLALPDSFGDNWDALDEVLADVDLDGHSGGFVVLDHATGFARANPAAWDMLIAIAHTAVQRWDEWGKAFAVAARGESAAIQLPELDLFEP